MYPQPELNRLAAHKLVLRRRIYDHRIQCACAVAEVAQPLAWLDRVVQFWRRLSPYTPFVAIPLGFVLKRSSAPRLLGAALRWGPLLLGAIRGLVAGVRGTSR
jgi:hypothetical protein